MTCKRLRTKALWEQDRWLSYLYTKDDPYSYGQPVRRIPTHEERLEFLRFDSHGGETPVNNPIYQGKMAAAVADTVKGADNPKKGGGGWLPYADELGEIYYDGRYWPGGLEVMEDYLRRVCGIGPLRKVFGDEMVARWLRAFLDLPWGMR